MALCQYERGSKLMFPSRLSQMTCNSDVSTHCVVIIGELSVGKSALCRKFFSNGRNSPPEGCGASSSHHQRRHHRRSVVKIEPQQQPTNVGLDDEEEEILDEDGANRE